MSNEPKNDEPGDLATDTSEETTLVLTPVDQLAGSYRAIAAGLRRAADVLDESERLVRKGVGPQALDDADDALGDLINIMIGARNGHRRVRRGLNGEGTKP